MNVCQQQIGRIGSVVNHKMKTRQHSPRPSFLASVRACHPTGRHHGPGRGGDEPRDEKTQGLEAADLLKRFEAASLKVAERQAQEAEEP